MAKKITYNKVKNPHARGPRKPKGKIQNWETPFGPFGAGYPDPFFPGPGIGGGINASYPPGNGFGQGQQVSSVDTSFANLRWYYISNMRNLLSELYVEIGLIQKVVNLPVDDGLRGGIEIQSKEMSEEEITILANSLDRDDDLTTIGWAEKWNRLYGGAGIIVLTDQDPDEPLDIASLGPDSSLEFRAVDMWEIFWDKNETEGWNPTQDNDDFQFYSYYGVQLHKSRVMRLKGMTAPSFVRPRLRGWGFSVVEALLRPLNQYLKATDLTFQVLDEFKIDVYKIKNYVNTLMSPQGMQAVDKRLQYANMQKNYQNALVMDSEDDWDHKQLSFAGLAETAAENRIQIASELGMPLTKIFGISAAGFNSGEDDIEVYNSMIESQVRNKVKYPILRMLEIKCQKLFGYIPTDLEISFKPLRMLSLEQEENVKTQKFNRLHMARMSQEISAEDFVAACNRGNLFDVQLNSIEGTEGGYNQDEIIEGQHDPYRPLDSDEEGGSGRADSRKSKSLEETAPHVTKGSQRGDGNEDSRRIGKASIDQDRSTKNSTAYDLASYRADGGDTWLDSRKLPFYENPSNKGLWAKAGAEASGNKKFQIWLYEKFGGTFAYNDKNTTQTNLRKDDYMNEDKEGQKGSLSEATRTWIRERADSDFKPPQTSTAMGVRGSKDSKVANPGKVDENKWAKAEDLTKKEYGTDKGKWGVVSTI